MDAKRSITEDGEMKVKDIGSVAIELCDTDYADYGLDLYIVEYEGMYFGAWTDPRARRGKATKRNYATIGGALDAAIREIEL